MRGVHVALLWQIFLMCNVPVLRFFMALVWYLFSLKTGLKNCHTLKNEAIVHRRSATLKAFDAVALQ